MNAPTEELRAAARLLRETASKATPGPWKTKGFGDFGWLVVDADPAGRFSVETEDNEHGRADAAWIALVSPAVADPLAAWLESVAHELSTAHPDWHPYLTRHALPVARLILGRTP